MIISEIFIFITHFKKIVYLSTYQVCRLLRKSGASHTCISLPHKKPQQTNKLTLINQFQIYLMVRDIQNKHTCIWSEISVVFWDFTVLISDLPVQGIKYQNCNKKPGKRHKYQNCKKKKSQKNGKQ